MFVRLALVLLAAATAATAAPLAGGLAQPACTFKLGFQTLRDQIPNQVGECLEDERFNVENGNAEQRTTGGLLVWRKADNWTAFTDGATTWIMGPEGLVSRPNAGPLFPWEAPAPAAAPPAAPPAPTPAPTAPPAAAPTPAPQPAAAPWIGDIRFGYDQSGSGAVPAGGNLPDVAEGTVYCFFAYRGLPPNAPVQVRILWGRDTRSEFDITPTRAEGTGRLVIIRFTSSEGGATFTFGDVGVVFSLGGRELARGSVAL